MKWPDARGWIGLGTFILTVLIIVVCWYDPRLREDEFFQTIATAIILTGWLNGVVSWAYAATKGGGELAEKNAAIVAESATAGVVAAAAVAEKAAAALPDPGKPTEVVVKNTEADPAIVTDAQSTPAEDLPEYAR